MTDCGSCPADSAKRWSIDSGYTCLLGDLSDPTCGMGWEGGPEDSGGHYQVRSVSQANGSLASTVRPGHQAHDLLCPIGRDCVAQRAMSTPVERGRGSTGRVRRWFCVPIPFRMGRATTANADNPPALVTE